MYRQLISNFTAGEKKTSFTSIFKRLEVCTSHQAMNWKEKKEKGQRKITILNDIEVSDPF